MGRAIVTALRKYRAVVSHRIGIPSGMRVSVSALGNVSPRSRIAGGGNRVYGCESRMPTF